MQGEEEEDLDSEIEALTSMQCSSQTRTWYYTSWYEMIADDVA